MQTPISDRDGSRQCLSIPVISGRTVNESVANLLGQILMELRENLETIKEKRFDKELER